MINFILILFFFLSSFWPATPVSAYDFQEIVKTDVIGEAFGVAVKNEEFLYHFKTASLFTRTGGNQQDRSDDDRRQEAWQNLVFVKEARDQGVTVPREELVAELKRLLFEKNVEYGSEQYTRWVIENFAEDPKTFERRIEDLLTINKLLKIKLDPEVTVLAFADRSSRSVSRRYVTAGRDHTTLEHAGEARPATPSGRLPDP